MVSDGYETRNVVSLRTGSKVAVLAGIPFLALAVYFYFVPLWVQGQNGVFGCGSASNPPSSDWAKGVCQGVSDASLYRAIAAAAVGVLIALVGVALFGVDKRAERRPVRAEREDYDDREEYVDDRPRRRRDEPAEHVTERESERDAEVEDDVERSSSRGRPSSPSDS